MGGFGRFVSGVGSEWGRPVGPGPRPTPGARCQREYKVLPRLVLKFSYDNTVIINMSCDVLNSRDSEPKNCTNS